MFDFLMKVTAAFLIAILLSGVPGLAPESLAGSKSISEDDTYEIDFDPDDPALDDDAYDAKHGLGEYRMKLSVDSEATDAASMIGSSGLRLNDEGDPDDPQNPVYDWFGVQGNNKGTVEYLKNKKGKPYEYRHLAGQKVYGYDTFQGACSHGKFSWHILYNRNNNKCRVIKVNMNTHKVVKVSKILPLDHGNDMTYDEKRDWLIVVHYEPHPKRLSVIDPNTLKVIKVKNLKMPTEKLPGASESFCKSIKGVTGIGYDSEYDEYIVSVMGTRHYAALDAKTYKFVRVIKVPELPPYVRQGMTVKDGFIIRAYSAYNSKYNQNILYVYDMTGNFTKTCKLGTGYEIESVFFDNYKMYAATYRSYLALKTKKVKVKGKKKKVKKTYYALQRDDNIISIKEY